MFHTGWHTRRAVCPTHSKNETRCHHHPQPQTGDKQQHNGHLDGANGRHEQSGYSKVEVVSTTAVISPASEPLLRRFTIMKKTKFGKEIQKELKKEHKS